VKAKTPPKYRRQRRKDGHDLAFVEPGGRRRYLGEYGTDDSHAEYNRLLAEWRANGGKPTVSKSDITIVEVIDRYTLYVKEYHKRSVVANSAMQVSCATRLRLRFGSRVLRVCFGVPTYGMEFRPGDVGDSLAAPGI